MTIMLVRNRVRDYARWRSVFDQQQGSAVEAGLRLLKLRQDMEDPNNVFFMFEVSDLDRARAYVSDPASAEVGRRAGVVDGELHYLEQNN